MQICKMCKINEEPLSPLSPFPALTHWRHPLPPRQPSTRLSMAAGVSCGAQQCCLPWPSPVGAGDATEERGLARRRACGARASRHTRAGRQLTPRLAAPHWQPPSPMTPRPQDGGGTGQRSLHFGSAACTGPPAPPQPCPLVTPCRSRA